MKQIIEKEELKTNIEPLHFLIGSWQTEGQIEPEAENKAMLIKGTDIYELVLGGHFILHQADVIIDTKRVTVIELIGEFEPTDQSWQMRSFDSDGQYTSMKAMMNNEFLQITGEKMRARLTPAEDGTYMVANWEKSEDGETWDPWMELKLTK